MPILNENDVVAVDEIGEVFGDNDRLSALVANLQLHSPVKPCILAAGFLIVIPTLDTRLQFSVGTPDFRRHCVYNGRLSLAPPKYCAAKNDVASGGECAFRNLA